MPNKEAEKSGLIMVGNFFPYQTGTIYYCQLLAGKLNDTGYGIIRTSRIRNRIARLIGMLATVFYKRNKYDAAYVEVYSGLSFVWAFLICHSLRVLKKPFVSVLHGGGLAGFHSRHRNLFELLLRNSTLVATPSAFLLESFRSVRNDIRYVPNGIDLGGYNFRLRNEFAPRFCWIRAFDNTYNPKLAVRVMRIICERYPNAKLSMIGPVKDRDLYESVLRDVREAGLESSIEFVGPVAKSEIPAILDRHDIFLNTTNFESFGVAVMEAAASGLPIVTTDAGELPYLWKHGVNAMMSGVDDADSMANSVLHILDNPGHAGKMALEARRLSESFSWGNVLPLWQGIFSDLEHMGSSKTSRN